MMKLYCLILILCAYSLVDCAPYKPTPGAIQILRYQYLPNPDGGYHFEYEGSDGQIIIEDAISSPFKSGDSTFSVIGTYSYIGKDGEKHHIDYVKDNNGYRETTGQEDSLSQAPFTLLPVPEQNIDAEVLRAAIES